MGGLQAGVTSNIILSMPPSDNSEDQVSLCCRSIVWNVSSSLVSSGQEVTDGEMPLGGDVHQCDRYLTIYIRVTEMRDFK